MKIPIIIVVTVILNLMLSIKIVICEKCGDNLLFKYRIERISRDKAKSTEYHISEIISNDEQGFYLELEEPMKYLCKGTLNITAPLDHFWASRRGIEVIEPGVFKNQQITGRLGLAQNLIRIIKKGTFVNMDITYLELHNNRITIVEEGAFENLPNLSVLYLSDNQIAEIRPNTIRNTPMMFSFSIARNKLKRLEENSLNFIGTKSLGIVVLSSNEIEQINPKTFGNVTKLSSISFSNNKIKAFPKELFEGYEYHVLDISNNSLTTLPGEFFNMKNVREVTLDGNNFDCDTFKRLNLYKEITKVHVVFDSKMAC